MRCTPSKLPLKEMLQTFRQRIKRHVTGVKYGVMFIVTQCSDTMDNSRCMLRTCQYAIWRIQNVKTNHLGNTKMTFFFGHVPWARDVVQNAKRSCRVAYQREKIKTHFSAHYLHSGGWQKSACSKVARACPREEEKALKVRDCSKMVPLSAVNLWSNQKRMTRALKQSKNGKLQ